MDVAVGGREASKGYVPGPVPTFTPRPMPLPECRPATVAAGPQIWPRMGLYGPDPAWGLEGEFDIPALTHSLHPV